MKAELQRATSADAAGSSTVHRFNPAPRRRITRERMEYEHA